MVYETDELELQYIDKVPISYRREYDLFNIKILGSGKFAFYNESDGILSYISNNIYYRFHFGTISDFDNKIHFHIDDELIDTIANYRINPYLIENLCCKKSIAIDINFKLALFSDNINIIIEENNITSWFKSKLLFFRKPNINLQNLINRLNSLYKNKNLFYKK